MRSWSRKDYTAGTRNPRRCCEIRRRFLCEHRGHDRGRKRKAHARFFPLAQAAASGPGFALCASTALKKTVKSFRTTDIPWSRIAGSTDLGVQGHPAEPFGWPAVVEGVVSRPGPASSARPSRKSASGKPSGSIPWLMHQGGETYLQELADRPLRAGDTLLLHGTWEKFHTLQDIHQNFIIITPFEQEFHKPEKAKWALTCFPGRPGADGGVQLLLPETCPTTPFPCRSV